MKEKNEKTLFVSFLLDETGSMQSIKDDTIGGFNEHLNELKKGSDETLFSLVSFNSSYTKKRYVAEPVAQVEPLTDSTYKPEAMTPLIDASVKIIKATEEAIKQREEDSDVVVVIQTDGQENVSVEYTNADLALLVKEKQAAGWEFLFLGAGMDAFDAAQDAGFVLERRHVMSYGRGKSKEAFDVMAAKMGAYRRHRVSSALDFTESERERAGDKYHEDDSDTDEPASKGRTRRGPSSVDDIDLQSVK